MKTSVFTVKCKLSRSRMRSCWIDLPPGLTGLPKQRQQVAGGISSFKQRIPLQKYSITTWNNLAAQSAHLELWFQCIFIDLAIVQGI